jgi:hypothetical protein
VGVRQLRRKQPAGGGSVPEATGAATDDAAAVMLAVAANVAFARPGLLSAMPTFSSSAKRKCREREQIHRDISQVTCERAGAPRVTCSKRPEATQWTCFADLCDAPDDD